MITLKKQRESYQFRYAGPNLPEAYFGSGFSVDPRTDPPTISIDFSNNLRPKRGSDKHIFARLHALDDWRDLREVTLSDQTIAKKLLGILPQLAEGPVGILLRTKFTRDIPYEGTLVLDSEKHWIVFRLKGPIG